MKFEYQTEVADSFFIFFYGMSNPIKNKLLDWNFNDLMFLRMSYIFSWTAPPTPFFWMYHQ